MIYLNEVKRMQVLAGILKESELNLDEDTLSEGVFDTFKKLVQGKTGDTLKKTIISLLIAGKLAMMSTATIAGAANKIDSSIDVESFKTELESAKGSKGTISASMSLEQKEKALGILGTSSIKTEDGKTI